MSVDLRRIKEDISKLKQAVAALQVIAGLTGYEIRHPIQPPAEQDKPKCEKCGGSGKLTVDGCGNTKPCPDPCHDWNKGKEPAKPFNPNTPTSNPVAGLELTLYPKKPAKPKDSDTEYYEKMAEANQPAKKTFHCLCGAEMEIKNDDKNRWWYRCEMDWKAGTSHYMMCGTLPTEAALLAELDNLPEVKHE